MRSDTSLHAYLDICYAGGAAKQARILHAFETPPVARYHAPVKPIVLITGGSRGIGAATALAAARAGYAVAVNYHANSLAADDVVRQIRAGGGTAITVQADVAVESQITAMFAKVDAKLGRISALVNNAGVVDTATRVDAMDWARLRRMFDTNVLGSIACAREAVLRMSTRHGGSGGSIARDDAATGAAAAAAGVFLCVLADRNAPQPGSAPPLAPHGHV